MTAPLGLGRRVIAPMVARYRSRSRIPKCACGCRTISSTSCRRASTSRSGSRACRIRASPCARSPRSSACSALRPPISEGAACPRRPRDLSQPRLPAVALSRLAAVPLDPRLSRRIGLGSGRRTGRRRRWRRIDAMGARRARHRAEAAIRGRRISRRRPARRGVAGGAAAIDDARHSLPDPPHAAARTKAFIDLAVEELRRHLARELQGAPARSPL